MIFLLPKRRPIIPAPKKRVAVKDSGGLRNHNGPKNRHDLKSRLDCLYLEINKPEFIPLDPVQFPRRYKKKNDIEIAAFLAATIAWGKRELILKSAEKMFALMGHSPYEFVMEWDYEKPEKPQAGGGNKRGFSIHRTFFEDDFVYFCRGFKACYAKYGNLENLFASAADVWEGMSLLRETMAAANSGAVINSGAASRGQSKKPLYSKHLSSPESGSACKRLNLALRWLVRKEGPVDLGIWKKLSPSSLFIPLDLHVGRAARELGLLESGRQANDKKAVISLTGKLREFCPEDPVKYDFALFGYSMSKSTKSS